MINQVTIQFYTPTLPPPYAYNITLDISNAKNGINVDFKLEYLDRESLTEEEIAEEGFTNNDDFEWNGALNNHWKDTIFNHIQNTKLSDKEDGKNIFISISENEKENRGYINDSKLEYLIQELQQAILEGAGRELPLTIHAKEVLKGKEVFSLSIIASFLERKVIVIKNTETGKREDILDWENLADLMSTVFSVSYIEDEGVSENEIKEGFYLETGDEVWYRVPDAIEGAQKNSKMAKSVMQALREL